MFTCYWLLNFKFVAGEMLHVAEAFIDKKYHPTVICRGILFFMFMLNFWVCIDYNVDITSFNLQLTTRLLKTLLLCWTRSLCLLMWMTVSFIIALSYAHIHNNNNNIESRKIQLLKNAYNLFICRVRYYDGFKKNIIWWNVKTGAANIVIICC